MTRNASHDLHTLSQTDPATEHTTVVTDANNATVESTATAEPAAAEPTHLTMRVLAWLPLRLWTDCGVCLFWRGAVVGALAAGTLASVVCVLM